MNESTKKERRRFNLRRVLIAISTLILLATTPFFVFSYISVCKQCGCDLQSCDLCIPFTPIWVLRYQRITPSPLSQFVAEWGIRKSHQHEWLFIHGGGNGVFCAWGLGGPVRSAAQSQAVAAFLADTKRYRGEGEAQTWLDMALDAQKSRTLRSWLDYPLEGLPSAPVYEYWRKQNEHSRQIWFVEFEDAKPDDDL